MRPFAITGRQCRKLGRDIRQIFFLPAFSRALFSGGRRFESCFPDHLSLRSYISRLSPLTFGTRPAPSAFVAPHCSSNISR
jgi:hypothetical protein